MLRILRHATRWCGLLLLLCGLLPQMLNAQRAFAAADRQTVATGVMPAAPSAMLSLGELSEEAYRQYDLKLIYDARLAGSVQLPAALLTLQKNRFMTALQEKLGSAGLQLTQVSSRQFGIIRQDKPEGALTPPVLPPPPGEISVSGTVKDQSGAPLVGVTIRVRGKTIGTFTNDQGHFALKTDPEDSLEISYVGYETRIVGIGSRQQLQIVLRADNGGLNEVVVVGYGTQQKRDLTGSVSAINQKAVVDLPVSSLDQKMIGQAAGVHILQQTGAPGGGTSVRIRGSGSIGAGDEPLYVIDGMPYSSSMNQTLNPLVFINPNDIESITVLKDASATAIYGSRGANGVIMITTKKGHYNETEVSVSAMMGVQQVPEKGRPKMMNQREFAELQRDKIDIAVRQVEHREPTSEDYPEVYRNLDMLKGNGTDWYDLLLRTARVQSYDLSLQKGTENSRMNFSLGYFKQDGTVQYTGLQRFSGKIGIESRLGSTVTVSASLQPTYIKQRRANTNQGRADIIGVSLWANPVLSPYDENGQLIPYLTSPDNKYFSAWDFPNPLYMLKEISQEQSQFQNLGSAFIEWEIVPGLKAKTSLNTIWSTAKYTSYIPSTVGSPNVPPTEGTGSSSNSRGDSFNWLVENTLTYDKNIGVHHLDILAGYTAQKSTGNTLNIDAGPYANDLIHTINGAQDISTWGENVDKWSMISYLGRINYSYKDRYLLTATIRSDGSSRFGDKERYALFPSVAGAWRISEEPFLKESSFFDDLKLRASYGKSGNNNIGNYSHLATITPGGYVLGNNEVTASSVGLPNSYLTWEESNEFDAGIDLSLFDSRLSLTVDYYYRKTSDMLLNDVIPAITGFNTQIVNAGSVKNAGLEISVGATPFRGDFSWDINMNMAFNRNKVLSLNANNDRILSGNNDGKPTHVTLVGRPIGQFFGYILDGVYTAADMEDPDVAKYPTAFEGAVKYRDIDGDGTITDVLDYTAIGNPYPDFTFGMNNRFSYRHFDLSVIINGQYGGHVMNGLRQTVDNLQGFFNVSREWVNRWRSEDQPGDGIHSGVIHTTPSLGHRLSTLWVEDATYLRIGNISLGYTLPGEMMKRTGFIKNIRVYLTMRNLATFTAYTGGNPEGQSQSQTNILSPGFDMTSYPLSRTVSAGINLSF
ncbi:TonB-dependent receptor [Compostibacter hankyongensis]|uniref:TonB-dependent receptor n=1 Tax=Compostibacter hankyongensis TaxID=1007089 RepID=A0ABP8G2S7_9BACT